MHGKGRKVTAMDAEFSRNYRRFSRFRRTGTVFLGRSQYYGIFRLGFAIIALPGIVMPCLLLLVLLLFPRVTLVLMWLFSTYLQRAFHGELLLPILGFIFLPLTTIVYAWELNSSMQTSGVNLLWLLIAVIIDLGGLGGGAHRQSRRN
jgi:hypothetical protein